MKIISLKAENFKRLKAVFIEPEGNVIPITGANEAGKSSVLDSIYAALGGKDNQPARPVRDGAEKASVELDLGDYIVRRTWTDTGTTALTVKSKDNAKYGSPQKLLDGLLGDFSLNPQDFLNAKNQRELLLRTVPLKFDLPRWESFAGQAASDASSDPLAFIDAARKARYEERHLINRDADRLRKAVEEQSGRVPAPIGQPVDVTALLKARDENQRKNVEIARNKAELQATLEKIGRTAAAIRELQAQQVALTKEAENISAKLDVAGQPADLAPLTARIAAAQDNNAAVAMARGQADILKRQHTELAALETRSADADAMIQQIDEFKTDMLESAAMPVPGLGFDIEGDVTLNGIPFGDCSHAQRLKVALALAMSANPTLRVIRITDGEKFDRASWAVIEEMAAANDMQVWIECMNESGDIGIFIEDGAVARINHAT